jgi:FkbM family methyltransferase
VNNIQIDLKGFLKNMEEEESDLIAKFLPDDPVVFEAGGHYGCDTIRFATKWPKGTIISFEPNPHAFAKLLETTKDFDNVYVHNFAINNYNGIAILNVCHGNFGDNPIFEGASSLLNASEWMEIHYQGPKLEVSCVVLDDWCQVNDVDHIDFIWLDLEGLELQVLKSSPKILEKVKVIYTETNFLEFRKGMTQFKDLKTFLENSGFQLLSHWYAEGFQGNVIFVKKELFELGFKN